MKETCRTEKSQALFEDAKRYMPGGVNSPARAFLAVDDNPRFMESANGAYIRDVDGNEYLDYIMSWGPMILGHNDAGIKKAVIKSTEKGISFGAATEAETDMAKLMCEMVPCFEKVRMVTSGTEATMSAVRAARGYTGRDKVIKFAGCYHGHHDALLVKAGSGLLLKENAEPDSAGVTVGTTKDTLPAEYNDLDAVRKLFEQHSGEIAAVIVEPVAANMGVVMPKKSFLEGLRELTSQNSAILIFDEVITGFRLSSGGAQKLFGVIPDMATFGKIIGGGLPVGAYGGRRDIMDSVAPVGSVYQAGTLAGNPLAVAAGKEQLLRLKNSPQIYRKLEDLGQRLFGGIKEILKEAGKPYKVNHIASIGSLFFTEHEVEDFKSASTSDLKAFADYFHHMISKGVSIAPSQFEALYISAAHTEKNIDDTLNIMREYFINGK